MFLPGTGTQYVSYFMPSIFIFVLQLVPSDFYWYLVRTGAVCIGISSDEIVIHTRTSTERYGRIRCGNRKVEHTVQAADGSLP